MAGVQHEGAPRVRILKNERGGGLSRAEIDSGSGNEFYCLIK